MTTLTVTLDQGVATLMLSRPEVRNAFNAELIAELTAQVQQLAQAPEVRVLVLRALGEHFSAGADLNWMRSMKDHSQQQNQEDASRLATLMRTLDECPKPLVGIANGAAMGGGVGLLACCDIVLASPSAFFALSEVRLGLTPATISPFVVRAIGARQARRYFQTGERFTAEQAQAMALVHEVVPDVELEARLTALLADLLAGGPQAQQMAKQLVKSVAEQPVSDALMADLAQRIGQQRVGAEGQEGLSAFLEKRKAAWVETQS
ncbi:MAG: enoyl-CoA hydratase-related protein [Saccharospirillum sp.]